MTTQPKARESELLPVTQADREAAAAFVSSQPKSWDGPSLRAGNHDRGKLVQAFARHRLATILATGVRQGQEREAVTPPRQADK